MQPDQAGKALWRGGLWQLAIDGAVIVAAGVSAFLLRFEFELPPDHRPELAAALVIWLCVKLVTFRLFRFDRRAWRFFSVNDVSQLVSVIVLTSLVSSLAIGLAVRGFPRSVMILDLILSGFFFSLRFLRGRFASEAWWCRADRGGRNVFIYGAGRSGVTLLSELRLNKALGCQVRGFIDDDRWLTGMSVQGAKVLGVGADLPGLALRSGVTEVLIAAPSASPDQMLVILKHCQRARVKYRTVPAVAEIVEGRAMSAQIRDVDVRDLLSRKPTELDHRLLREKIEGRVVMVTGAAGSIGSELCRQLAKYKPSAIVAFEIAETPLYHLVREMAGAFPDVPCIAEIGNVQNHRRVSAVIAVHAPATIYHAAAYKHVPMMESSVLEAVTNNLLGTQVVARAAREYGVEEFVLISSDKAVHPTSMMGATKRLCEKLIFDMPSDRTAFVAVRFGNVLGSNGSVIPLFKEQIAKGGPITVTHPEMKRYFMTIPEASQLVLQAAAMGRGGEIFVLDMGEQVKIMDIARKLVILSGLTPDLDIHIEVTGVRPGEKLYEELNLEEETTVPTGHGKIKIFTGGSGTKSSVLESMSRIGRLCEDGRAAELIEVVRDLVPEYQPSEVVLSRALQRDGLVRIGAHEDSERSTRAAVAGA